MFRIFLLFFFLIGCENRQVSYIDPEAQPYVERFKDLIGVYPIGTSISLVDTLPAEKTGQCSLTIYKSSITINRMYWELYSDYGRENIVFHELGHCFLNYKHDDRLFQDGCPASIMNYLHFGNTICYSFHRNKLFKLYKDQSGL